MIPIGNLDFGHLYDTPSYLATPIPYKSYEVDNLLLEYVGLPHVLVIAVPLVYLFSWVGQRIILRLSFHGALLHS